MQAKLRKLGLFKTEMEFLVELRRLQGTEDQKDLARISEEADALIDFVKRASVLAGR